MESFYQTLTRVSNIKKSIVKTFSNYPNYTSRSEKSNKVANSFKREFNLSVKNATVEKKDTLPSYVISDNSLRREEKPFEEIINKSARKYNIPASLIKSIIKVESSFDPLAISPKGAQGLMQIMPQTAKELKLDYPFRPDSNVDKGVYYFKKLVNRYDGDIVKALAAYNAGGQNLIDEKVPKFKETKSYIKKVISEYLKYSGVE